MRHVEQAVRAAADAQGFALDAGQERALPLLAALAAPRRRRRAPRGVFLWGPPGRGKTWLVDAVVRALPADGVLRVHSLELYARLHAAVGTRLFAGGALQGVVEELLAGCRLLCLDELDVRDSDDAWLAQRLLTRLLDRGGRLVVTSNSPVDGVLPHPEFHRHAAGLVALLHGAVEEVHLDGPVDHRTSAAAGQDRPRYRSGAYLTPGTAAQLAALGLHPPPAGPVPPLRVQGRALRARADSGTLWARYADVCEAPTAAADYAELAALPTWVLTRVPRLAESTPDGRQRLLTLVDVAYDRDVRLVLLAAQPLAETVAAPDLPPGFPRTLSRLRLLGGTPAGCAWLDTQ